MKMKDQEKETYGRRERRREEHAVHTRTSSSNFKHRIVGQNGRTPALRGQKSHISTLLWKLQRKGSSTSGMQAAASLSFTPDCRTQFRLKKQILQESTISKSFPKTSNGMT